MGRVQREAIDVEDEEERPDGVNVNFRRVRQNRRGTMAAIALALAGVAGAETSASEWLAAIRAASPAIRDDVYAQLAQYQRLYGGHLYLYKPKEAQDLF